MSKLHIKQFFKNIFTVCLPFIIQYFILALLKVLLIHYKTLFRVNVK